VDEGTQVSHSLDGGSARDSEQQGAPAWQPGSALLERGETSSYSGSDAGEEDGEEDIVAADNAALAVVLAAEARQQGPRRTSAVSAACGVMQCLRSPAPCGPHPACRRCAAPGLTMPAHWAG
jgi:hypothetical protein